MNVFDQKYNNFIKFLEKLKIESIIKNQLNSLNSYSFILLFKAQYKLFNESKENIKNYIKQQYNINESDYDQEDIKKLELYMNYFIEVSKQF